MTYSNTMQGVGVEVAAKVVERVAGGGLRGSAVGLLVQPAVWAATGTAPDAADVFLYGTGAAGVVAGATVAVPALLVGMLKGYMDDRTQTLVDEAKLSEPALYRDGIQPLGNFGFWANDNSTQAAVIASYGGVAWQHPNGALCFIRDANGRLVSDYEPAAFTWVYCPELPLVAAGNGRVRWYVRRTR